MLESASETIGPSTTSVGAVKAIPWPKESLEQVRAVASVLSASVEPLDMKELAMNFAGRGAWKKRLPVLLETLVALGRATESNGKYRAVRSN